MKQYDREKKKGDARGNRVMWGKAIVDVLVFRGALCANFLTGKTQR
jgi:hypothetical protein